VGLTDELTITWNFWPAASVTVAGVNVVLRVTALIIGAPPDTTGNDELADGLPVDPGVGVADADDEGVPCAVGVLVVALPQADSAAAVASIAPAVMTSVRTLMAASRIWAGC
jgi:hypothetical protein